MIQTMNKSRQDLWIISFDVPMDVLPIPIGQQIFRYSIASIGILLNCILLIVVGGSRQLRYPRHLYWLAISLINLFYLLQCISEIVAIVHRNRLACQFYTLNAGVGYSLLLLVLSLAALDRYLVIAHQEWYKKKVTNRSVSIALCLASALTYIVITCPFWTGYKKISKCAVNLTHMHWILVWNLLLGIWCLILHIKVYVKSRAIIRLYHVNFNQNPIIVQFQNVSQRVDSPVLDCGFPLMDITTTRLARIDSIQADQQQQAGINNTQATTTQFQIALDVVPQTDCFPWFHHIRPQINRLDIRAALSMSINILPFWVCTFPVTCNAIALYWCVQLRSDCSIIFAISPYLRNMFLAHVIYNPTMYMLSNFEFRRALARFIRRYLVDFFRRISTLFFCLQTFVRS